MALRDPKNVEWKAAYAVAGLIDVVQWILTPFAIDEILNPIIGVLIAAYFQMRGVNLTHYPKRLLSLLAGFTAEELSDSVAPAWIFDVWYIHRDVAAEAVAEEAMITAEETAKTGPIYQNGVRRPANAQKPMNQSGRREPINVQAAYDEELPLAG